VISRLGRPGRRPDPKKPTALRGVVGVWNCESSDRIKGRFTLLISLQKNNQTNARAVFLSAGKAGKISTEPALSWVGEAISLPVARLAGVGFAHCLAVGKHNPGAYSFIDRRDSNPT